MTTIKHAEQETISWFMVAIVVCLTAAILWLANDILLMLMEAQWIAK